MNATTETINSIKTENLNIDIWRSHLKSGDQVGVLIDGYTVPGVVIKLDIDDTVLIRISGQNTALWHSNLNIFPRVKK